MMSYAAPSRLFARLCPALLLAVAALTLGGCNLPTVAYYEIDDTQMRYNDGTPRPVAMYQPAQAVALQSSATDANAPLPWYATRNDLRRSVTSGYRTQVFESTYTRQYDRQYASGGNVRDHGSITTHTRRYVETVR